MMKWISAFINWLSRPFGSGVVPGENPQVDAIQKAAVTACGFLPLADTVLSIVGSAAPGAMTASSAANYICNIVTKTPPVASPAGAATLMSGQAAGVQTWQAPDGRVIQGSFVGRR